MSEIRTGLKYLSSHEWACIEDDGTITVGITDHAQESLGDIVYVECPEVGSTVTAGDQAGVVESVKAASDIYSPISGEVIEINELLEENPEIVNKSPFDDGWFYKVKADDLSDLDGALDSEGYEQQIADE